MDEDCAIETWDMMDVVFRRRMGPGRNCGDKDHRATSTGVGAVVAHPEATT